MQILWLVLRRLRDLIIVLVFVDTALFLILHSIPGSPAASLLGSNATDDQIAQLNATMGFDRPLFEQYVIWFGNLLQGDLGYSFSQGTQVGTAILAHLGPTLVLALTTTAIGILLAVPLAVLTVARPTSPISRGLLGLATVALSIPNFWLALILILAFAVTFPIFPVSGYVSPFEDFGRASWFLTLPVAVAVSHQVALLVLTLRESMSSELLSHYVRTARAKGSNEGQVLYRHLLPNSLLPAVTVIANNFGTLLGGVIILETIFLIPGIGWLLYGGILSRDYNLVLGVTLCTALLLVLINLLVDIVYGLLDPRVRVK